MEIFKNIVLSLFVISEFIILFFAGKSRRFFKVLLLNTVISIASIAIVNLTYKYTNCYIPINLYSIIFSSGLGVPAVIGLVIFKFIFL
jgi:hypothetical protein